VEKSPPSVTGGYCGDKTGPKYNYRPVILDPADPTGNLGHNARWDLLAKEAAAYTSALCCMDKDGNPIKPWPVKVRPCETDRGIADVGMGKTAMASMVPVPPLPVW